MWLDNIKKSDTIYLVMIGEGNFFAKEMTVREIKRYENNITEFRNGQLSPKNIQMIYMKVKSGKRNICLNGVYVKEYDSAVKVVDADVLTADETWREGVKADTVYIAKSKEDIGEFLATTLSSYEQGKYVAQPSFEINRLYDKLFFDYERAETQFKMVSEVFDQKRTALRRIEAEERQREAPECMSNMSHNDALYEEMLEDIRMGLI